MANRREILSIESEVKKLADKFPDRTERVTRVFLEREDVYRGATILDGKKPFTITNDEGEQETCIPDIDLISKNGKPIYIEVTKSSKNGTDPNKRDREIMKKAAPNSLFVVFYSRTLKAIQRNYPSYNFFKEEKKKRKKKNLLYSDKGGHRGRAIAKEAQGKAARKAGVIFLCKPTVHLDCPKRKRRDNRGGKGYK